MKTIWLRRPALLVCALLLVLALFALGPAPAQQAPASAVADSSHPTGQHSQEWLAQDLEHAIAKVQPLLDRYGYPAVFLAVFVEGFGLLAPGQSLLIAASLNAAKGGLNITWVLLCAFTGAVLGTSLGYVIGSRGGLPLLHKIGVKEQRLQRMEGYFRRYGKGVVLIARFFDGLRQLNGIMAGMLRMPWLMFTTFNVLGALLWTGVWGLGTYFLEKRIASSYVTVRTLEPWIAAFCVLAFLAVLVYLLRQRGRKNG